MSYLQQTYSSIAIAKARMQWSIPIASLLYYINCHDLILPIISSKTNTIATEAITMISVCDRLPL